jgi:hypothetical protein
VGVERNKLKSTNILLFLLKKNWGRGTPEPRHSLSSIVGGIFPEALAASRGDIGVQTIYFSDGLFVGLFSLNKPEMPACLQSEDSVSVTVAAAVVLQETFGGRAFFLVSVTLWTHLP